jgi:hypothetical protein
MSRLIEPLPFLSTDLIDDSNGSCPLVAWNPARPTLAVLYGSLGCTIDLL